jgi:hypothetical protein
MIDVVIVAASGFPPQAQLPTKNKPKETEAECGLPRSVAPLALLCRACAIQKNIAQKAHLSGFMKPVVIRRLKARGSTHKKAKAHPSEFHDRRDSGYMDAWLPRPKYPAARRRRNKTVKLLFLVGMRGPFLLFGTRL